MEFNNPINLTQKKTISTWSSINLLQLVLESQFLQVEH
jgi:hypothetical protein